ncbi:MAG: hypothetical protein ACRECR_03705 [Thermoplasmata archaeon]
MIAFFSQRAFASASGYPTLPNGIFFGGGTAAAHQLGVELFGMAVVLAVVFAISWVSIAALARLLGGVTTEPSAPEPTR